MDNKKLLVFTIALTIFSVAANNISFAQLSRAKREKKSMKFTTTKTIPSSVFDEFCSVNGSPAEWRVTILKDKDGNIGGFAAQRLIVDSPVFFQSSEGKILTTFHIFAPDHEKKKATQIIDELKKQFPIEEILECNSPRLKSK